ncbi:MAG TPA: hypothetical protein VGB08_08855 [Allosphingosinicella sp.]|jgi:hypothetical protein
MPILMVLFGPLVVVALAAAVLSSVLFRNAPPLKRSALTALAAWLIASIGSYFAAGDRPATIWYLLLLYLPYGVIVWLLMWRSFCLYWEPDAPAEAMPTHSAVGGEQWPTIHGGEESYWPAEPEPEPHRNYVVRHWRGECSLPASYWLNSSLISGAAIFAAALGIHAMEETHLSLQAVAAAALLFLALTVALWAWGAVGTWRSAQLHEDRGGSGGWAIAAQVMVVFGALGMFLQLRPYMLQTHEFGVLAFGGDPLGDPGQVTLSQDGTAIRIDGTLTSGVSGRFRALAADAPRLRTVVLTSPGGRQLEAMRIADTIAERRLDTRAEIECLSACTFVLLAGRERTATEDTAVGFHQPSFPGWTEADTRAATRQMELDYRRAGVAPHFIARAAQTPAGDMWVPPHDDLIAANVLTSSELVVVASDAAPAEEPLESELRQAAAVANARLPMRLDPVTRLEAVEASGRVLTYRHRVEARRVDVSAARAGMRRTVPQQACGDEAVADAVARGATIVYAFRDERGRALFDVPVTACRNRSGA